MITQRHLVGGAIVGGDLVEPRRDVLDGRGDLGAELTRRRLEPDLLPLLLTGHCVPHLQNAADMPAYEVGPCARD